MGDILFYQREKSPIFIGKKLVEADLFLYQIRDAFDLVHDESRYQVDTWYPRCYYYVRTTPEEWTKIKSRNYCKVLYDLFNVNSIEDLKIVIAKCASNKERYRSSYDRPFLILDYIKLEDIGAYN